MKSKIIVVLILVLTLSIGFATLSNQLKIDLDSKVNPNPESFAVVFSSSESEVSTNDIIPTKIGDFTASSATISNGDIPTVKDISIEFNEASQEVQYVFYVHNTGKYDAYLNAVEFQNASGESKFKKCTAISGTSQSVVDSICDDITLTLSIGDLNISDSDDNINEHVLTQTNNETVTLTIKYNSSANTSSLDGDFIVEFGTISLKYQSVD